MFVRWPLVSAGLPSWARWLQEDRGASPCQWLRADCVSPSPLLVIGDKETMSSRILVEHHVVDAEFRKAWMHIFVGLVTPSSLLSSSWNLWPLFCCWWCGSWFSGLVVLLSMVESTGVWPQRVPDAYIAMIPEDDGDSTLLGQRPLCVLPVGSWLWASQSNGLGQGLGSGVRVQLWQWWEALSSTTLDIEALSGACDDQLHVLVADVICFFRHC